MSDNALDIEQVVLGLDPEQAKAFDGMCRDRAAQRFENYAGYDELMEDHEERDPVHLSTARFHLKLAEHVVLNREGETEGDRVRAIEERWQWETLAQLYGASPDAVPLVAPLTDGWTGTWAELLDTAESLARQR